MGKTMTYIKMLLLSVLLLTACRSEPVAVPAVKDSGPEPTPIAQARAYPETVTGFFVSLADFEDSPDGARGFEEVQRFEFFPQRDRAEKAFAVNVTRTGVGSLRVNLPAGCELLYNVPDINDMRGYTLVSLSIYSESVRDDLRLRLVSESGSWTSPRNLIKRGWNTVLVDIRRLSRLQNFSLRRVQKVGVTFSDATGPTEFYLDDVLLIDNQRKLACAPDAVELRKAGLDYILRIPGRSSPLVLSQQSDGHWRFENAGIRLQLSGRGQPPPAGEDDRLRLLGNRTIGSVDLLECNKVRVRIATTAWYPARAGEWASLSVRRVRRVHTFYPDGRWITAVELNNAGGRDVETVRLVSQSGPVAWAGGPIAESLAQQDFLGPVGRWFALSAPNGSEQEALLAGFADPASVSVGLGSLGSSAPGDLNGDGFDESQGCYYLQAHRGHCRFTVEPGAEPLVRPVFRIWARWSGDVRVNSEGLPIRDVVHLEDGSILFQLPNVVREATSVEVTGPAAVER
ncbi:MAG: hypothetical protein ACLFVU_06755 [Phycisphaerae bacterium]